MDTTSLKPNSNKYKQEQLEKQEKPIEKRVERVVTGGVQTKKKSSVRKFLEVFIADDFEKVKSYAKTDVLAPAIKNALYDIVTYGADLFIFGGRRGGSGRPSSVSKISYRDYYNKPADRRHNEEPPARNRFDYDDLVFTNRGDAELVLDQMDEAIQRYKLVRVFDMYDAAGITAPFTAYNYGWTDISSATIERVRDGYIIKMPRALPVE